MATGEKTSPRSSSKHLSKLLKKYIINSENDIAVRLSAYIPKVPSTQKYETVLSLQDDKKRTALHHAAIRGDTEIISGIVDVISEEQRNHIISVIDNLGDHSVALAALNGSAKAMRILLDAVGENTKREILKTQNRSGLSALHAAACQGQTQAIKAVMDSVNEEQRVDLLKLQDRYGDTAVSHAACNGHTETAQFLLEITSLDNNYEIVKKQNKSGQTAIHQAASKGKTGAIKAILDSVTNENRTDLLLIQDRSGDSAIAFAALYGHADAVKCLINVNSTKITFEMLKIQNKRGLSILHKAALGGHLSVINTIFNSTTEEQRLSLLRLPDNYADTAVAYAASYGHADTVRCMLSSLNSDERFEMLKALNKSGQSALHKAAFNGHHQVFERVISLVTREQLHLLLMPQSEDPTLTVVSLAAYYGHVETVRIILTTVNPALRYDMLKVPNNAGQSTIHVIVYHGHTDLFKVVATMISEKNLFDLLKLKEAKGETAVNHAVCKRHKGTLKTILSSLEPDNRYNLLGWRNSQGQTVLHQAANNGFTDVLQVISDSVSKEQIYDLVTLQDHHGNTAITLAAIRGYTATVETILDLAEGATKKYEMLKLVNLGGRSTAHNAALKGHTNVLMAIMNSLSGEQLLDLLKLQEDCNGHSALALLKTGGHTKTVQHMQSALAKFGEVTGDGGGAQSELEQENPKLSKERRESLYTKNIELEEANVELAKQLSDGQQKYEEKEKQTLLKLAEVEKQLKLQKREDEAQHKYEKQEKQTLLKLAEVEKQLKLQKRENEELRARLSKLEERPKDDLSHKAPVSPTISKASTSVTATVARKRKQDESDQVKEDQQQVSAAKRKKDKTSTKSTDDTMASNTGGQSKELQTKELPSDNRDPSITPRAAANNDGAIDPALIEKISSLCEKRGVLDHLLLQNPKNLKNIAILGTNTEKILEEDLNALNEQFKEYTVFASKKRGKVYTRQLGWKNCLKMERMGVESNGTCELIIQATNRMGEEVSYAVGPAHMVVPDGENQILMANANIADLRNMVEQHPPTKVYRFRSGDFHEGEHDEHEEQGEPLNVVTNHPPLLGFRYFYPKPLAPSHVGDKDVMEQEDEASELEGRYCLSDVTLLPFNNENAPTIQRRLISFRDTRIESLVKVPTWNLLKEYNRPEEWGKTIRIAVKNFSGYLARNFHCIRYQKNEGIAHHLLFAIDQGKLTEGDSGSIVYEVRQGEEGAVSHLPLGMLVGEAVSDFGDIYYQAMILDRAFNDLQNDYPDDLVSIRVSTS